MDWGKYKAWFIGPKAENKEIFKELIGRTLDENMYWRKNFHPEDNLNAQLDDWSSEEVRASINILKEKLSVLSDRIKNSTPFFSPRYMGHMGTDPSLPAFVGYFAGMIFNNNNTTEEAAPSTITIEAEAVEKLCRMACMPNEAWGHLTTGGSGANYHCLWRARDTRFFPYVFAATYLTTTPEVKRLIDRIELEHGRVIGDAIEENELHLLSTQDIYFLLEEMETLVHNHPQLGKEMEAHSIYQLGYMGFVDLMRERLKDRFPKSFKWLVNKSVHYSIEKCLNFLGFGHQDIIPIELNSKWEMDINYIDQTADSLIRNGDAPIGLVAIFGSTEVGATDNFDAIGKCLDSRRKKMKGDMWLHADLAWGSYYLSLYHPEEMRHQNALSDTLNDLIEYELKSSPLKVNEGWRELLDKWADKFLLNASGVKNADSITMDPHKTGYVPYPCGASLFKNYRVRETAHYSFPPVTAKKRIEDPQSVVWDVPRIAYYTVEGSRTSVGATAAWLAHETIPLDISGMGHLMGRSVLSAMFFQNLLDNWTFHFNSNSSVRFVFLDKVPMTGITCYTFEIIYHGETVPLKTLNEILSELYERQVLFNLGDLYGKNFILTKTVMDASMYNNELHEFLKNTEIDSQLFAGENSEGTHNPWRDDNNLVVLRNVLFDPFFLTYQCKSSEMKTREQRPIILEYCDFIVNQLAEITKDVCNRKIQEKDRVHLLGNLMIVDDNLELTSLLKMNLTEDFLDSSSSIIVRRSTDEAVNYLKESEVHAVVTGLDLGPGEERGGVTVLKEAAKNPQCKGVVLFTQADYKVAEVILSEMKEERPDWQVYYLPHFELTSDTSQFTINRLGEMVWKIINRGEHKN